jgi:hypothetical protein
MKRILTTTILLISACGLVAAQGKIKIKCPPPSELKLGITKCPPTGCGPSLDPFLNEQKNIRSDSGTVKPMTIPEMQELTDPVPDYEIGDTREKLAALGEGDKISVVAFALVARKGVKESCNCGLRAPKDTDNHIVLVDEPILKKRARATRARPATATRKAVKARTARQNTLALRERFSTTAEFAPRVRLDHPKLTGTRLQSFIEATPKKALKVRVTGLLMFDSQHSLEGHLRRVNNWEIHPVMKMEFCPSGETCTADSDDSWEDLEDQP